MPEQIKVLIVDDSSLVRKIVADMLESDPMIKVVGTADNGKLAIFKNKELNPDVITLDIEMPVMDGLTALKYIIETNPKPVIMMSVLTQHGAEATFKALELGAVDFIPKPSSVLSMSVDEIGSLLISKVKAVAGSRLNLSQAVLSRKEQFEPAKKPQIMKLGSVSSKIVGIGTSTGGPSALLSVFRALPENFPSPVVVVQHMPEGFTHAFAERLNGLSKLTVKEAEDGDRLDPCSGYIAPGHSHMEVVRNGKEIRVRIFKSQKVSGHMPSIDVLFSSLAENIGGNTVAVIMTGMGKDGANGIMKIKERGGYTVAQDEKTSVVYGMNRVAVNYGAIRDVVPLSEISKKIVEHI